MPVKPATDTDLRTLIFEHPKVVVIFTTANCPICKRMLQTYVKLADQPRFQEILFLHMEASENPVSSQEVHLTGTPFFATYNNSILSICKLISNEAELEELLTGLL